mmetsp:Transcript_7250/g.19473  ORF Transcript_7250/g.19473 Transcript_7250/m.19473 type:complete len:218 (-) Transcript_7250:463-1116(-)
MGPRFLSTSSLEVARWPKMPSKPFWMVAMKPPSFEGTISARSASFFGEAWATPRFRNSPKPLPIMVSSTRFGDSAREPWRRSGNSSPRRLLSGSRPLGPEPSSSSCGARACQPKSFARPPKLSGRNEPLPSGRTGPREPRRSRGSRDWARGEPRPPPFALRFRGPGPPPPPRPAGREPALSASPPKSPAYSLKGFANMLEERWLWLPASGERWLYSA